MDSGAPPRSSASDAAKVKRPPRFTKSGVGATRRGLGTIQIQTAPVVSRAQPEAIDGDAGQGRRMSGESSPYSAGPRPVAGSYMSGATDSAISAYPPVPDGGIVRRARRPAETRRPRR